MLGISKIKAGGGNLEAALDYYEKTMERGIGEDRPVVREGMTPEQAQTYYSEAGHAPVAMYGSGREALGFGSEYDPEGFRAMLAGADPRTGERLRTGPGRPSTVAAYDLTFSAPKSVSLLFAGARDEAVREAVIEAHQAAVQEGFAHVERVAALSRKGRTFTEADGSQVYRQHTVGSDGFVAAGFEHFTSRAGDPQLHTHMITVNRVLTDTGEWLAVDGKALYRHAKEGGVVYQAALRKELVERLGVEFGLVRNGQADLVAVPASVRHEFSQRRVEIEEALEVWRRVNPDKEVTKAVETYLAQQTRQPKQYPVGEMPVSRVMRDDGIGGDVEATWQQRIHDVNERLGIDLADVFEEAVGEARAVYAPTPQRVEEVASRVVAAMDETHATWGAPDLVSQVADELFRFGGDAQDLMTTTQAVLAHAEANGDVIRMLETPAAGSLPEGVSLTAAEVAVLDARTTWVEGRGARFRGLPGEARYTTRAQLQREIMFMDAVGEPAPAPNIDPAQLVAVIDDRGLVPAQANAVRAIAAAESRVVLVQAPAGSGKTYTVGAYADAIHASGAPVIGVAKSAAAAAKLRDDMPARTYVATIDKLRFDEITHVDLGGLQPGTTIVVDEASMVGASDWAWLVERVQAVDGRIVAVGDVKQLPSVDPGGLFHRAVREHRDTDVVVSDLEGLNLRQRTDVDKAMLTRYRSGDVQAAVMDLHERGRVVLTATHADARAATVTAWWADAQEHGLDLAAVRMVANTRDDVATLNALAKTEAATAGLIDVAGPTVSGREGQRFHVGDRVVARQNAPAFRHIVNGDCGTITTIDDHGRVSMLRDRDGVTVTLPKRYATEALDLGYATTRHQAQGATYEATHVLHGDGGSHEGGYVALSRSRGDTTLYAAETLTPAGECAHHIAPDAPDPLHRIIDDLTRSALDPSASERGYGVTASSDAELVTWRNQLAAELRQSPLAVDVSADLSAVRDALEQNPAPLQAQALHAELRRLETRQAGRVDWVEHNSDTVATYQAIAAELKERHHTLTAINQLEPPTEVLYVLGPKPDDPATLREWHRAVASYSKDSIQVPRQSGETLLANPVATEWRNAAQRYQTRTQLIEARRPAVPVPVRLAGF